MSEQSREESSAVEVSPGDQPLSGTAVASFCFGLSGLVAFFLVIFVFKVKPGLPEFMDRMVLPVMGITPIVVIAGIVFGRLARIDIQGGKSRGARFARAGLGLSYTAAISIVVGIVWFIVWFIDSLAGI